MPFSGNPRGNANCRTSNTPFWFCITFLLHFVFNLVCNYKHFYIWLLQIGLHISFYSHSKIHQYLISIWFHNIRETWKDQRWCITLPMKYFSLFFEILGSFFDLGIIVLSCSFPSLFLVSDNVCLKPGTENDVGRTIKNTIVFVEIYCDFIARAGRYSILCLRKKGAALSSVLLWLKIAYFLTRVITTVFFSFSNLLDFLYFVNCVVNLIKKSRHFISLYRVYILDSTRLLAI